MPSAETAAATILVAIYLAFVLLRVQREWVRVPAIAYARQFLAACDALSSPKRTATNKNKRKRTDAD